MRRYVALTLMAGCLVLGAGLSVAPSLSVALTVCFATAVLVGSRPKRAFILWLAGTVIVPYWVGIEILTYLPVSVLAAIPLLVLAARGRWWAPIPADWLVILVALLCSFVSIGSPLGPGSTAVLYTHWLLAYALGRYCSREVGSTWVINTFTLAMALVGFAAVLETIMHLQLFSGLAVPNLPYKIWSPVQVRGGFPRAEWSFGHSIALGSSLALALPLIGGSTYRPSVRWLMMVSISLGVMATLSRGPILAALLGTAIVVWISRRSRASFTVLLAAAILVVAPFARGIATEERDELNQTAFYRQELVGSLIGTIEVLGPSRSLTIVDGSPRFLNGTYGSIDNMALLFALTYGWVPTLVLAIGYAFLFRRIVFQRASLWDVAVVAQLPALLTVSLITQYQLLFWFCIGLAVSQHREVTSQYRDDSMCLRE